MLLLKTTACSAWFMQLPRLRDWPVTHSDSGRGLDLVQVLAPIPELARAAVFDTSSRIAGLAGYRCPCVRFRTDPGGRTVNTFGENESSQMEDGGVPVLSSVVPSITCPCCGRHMRLSLVEPEQRCVDRDRMTFDCDCGFEYRQSRLVAEERCR